MADADVHAGYAMARLTNSCRQGTGLSEAKRNCAAGGAFAQVAWIELARQQTKQGLSTPDKAVKERRGS